MLAASVVSTHLMPIVPPIPPSCDNQKCFKISTKCFLLVGKIALSRNSGVTDLEVGLGATQ